MTYIKGLSNMRELWLYDTKITDKAVASIARLKNLRVLSVAGTGITEEGLEELKKAIPRGEIFY